MSKDMPTYCHNCRRPLSLSELAAIDAARQGEGGAA